ncbi:MAG: cytochrome c biogenesis CcdA family protein [Acidimicrobiales bacterium]
MDAVPLSLAFVAGALSVLNPCGFPLLPAFLSFYVGAEEQTLPSPANRAAQGLFVGLLVAAGFLAVFAVVGLPVTLGVRTVAAAVPFAGAAVGLALLFLGLYVVVGNNLRLPLARHTGVSADRRARTIVLFGIGYGVASLGCTLPIFLTLIAASLGATGFAASVAAFASYGLGMALVLMALSVAAALFRDQLARNLRRVLPYFPRLTGAMLAVAGVYLSYYWLRYQFGPRATLASDPVVGVVTRFTAQVSVSAENRGEWFVLAAGAVVGVAIGVAVLRRRRSVTVPLPRGGSE